MLKLGEWRLLLWLLWLSHCSRRVQELWVGHSQAAEGLRETFAGLSIVVGLTDPNLRDEFGIEGGKGSMEGQLIKGAIDRGGKEHQGHALAGLDLQVEGGKTGGAAPCDVV
jgi:hypothetical protein